MTVPHVETSPAWIERDLTAEKSLSALLFQDEPVSLVRLANEPGGKWSQDPGVLLAIAAAHRWDGLKGAYTALPYLETAERVLRATGDAPLRLTAAAALLRGIIDRTRGQTGDALEQTEQAIKALRSPGTSITDRIDMGAIALLKRGAANVLAGELADAKRDLRAGVLAGDGRIPVREHVEALGFLALVDVLSGSLRTAERTLVEVEALDTGAPRGLWTAPATIASLMLAAERGTLTAHAPAVHRLLDAVAGSEFEVLALHVLVLLCHSAGDWYGALEGLRRMREIEQNSTRTELFRLLRLSDRADVHLASGDLAPARRAMEREADPQHLVCANATRARVALLLGDFETAARETHGCLAEGEDHPARSWLYTLIINSAAHWALGDICSAEGSFRLALRQAASTGARRAFSTVPPRILAGLLERTGERSDLTATERSVLGELAELVPAAAQDTSDLLSPRERVVLLRLATGESPREVAATLHVSVNTVKTQLRSIYRKLGASTRAGAVERARTLGVLAA